MQEDEIRAGIFVSAGMPEESRILYIVKADNKEQSYVTIDLYSMGLTHLSWYVPSVVLDEVEPTEALHKKTILAAFSDDKTQLSD